MSAIRLSAETKVTSTPGYTPENHGVGIVHIGLGAFHRAHQAVYTDDALATAGGDWRIKGVSLRSTDIADALNPQGGRYTVLERGVGGTEARIIGSIANVIGATRDRTGVVQALINSGTRIVSLTVTEKGYGIDRANGGIDVEHPAITQDLADPHNPVSAIGLIVEGLRRRRALGLPAYTVLCCDNLPENGKLLRSAVLDFSTRLDKDLRDWIAADVAFPCTMVDRITPASTAKTLLDAETFIGMKDLAAVETEPFSQWVIEDNFPLGRPAWEAGGAIFVKDVVPFERMKLRMLNGSHSLIAYSGFLAKYPYVRDAMADPDIVTLVSRHLTAAAQTLKPLPGINFDVYAANLAARFSNPEIAHETYQIAMDGSEKIPQRFLEPARWALAHKQDIRPFAFGVAIWMRYCLGYHDDGSQYALNDPRERQIKKAVKSTDQNAALISDALHRLTDVFPRDLIHNQIWRSTVEDALRRILSKGMKAAITAEAQN